MTIDTWIKIWRTGFVVSFFGATQFLICCALAMIWYPGGTIANPDTAGYQVGQNYMSDLGREISLSREDNSKASKLFNGSLILLGICSLPFYLFLPTHAHDKVGWLTIAAAIGVVSSISLVVMGMSPVDLSPIAHHGALFTWIVATFFVTSIHALCMLTSSEGISMAMSLISVAVAMLTVSYIYHATETAGAVLFNRPVPLKSVLLQKLVVIGSMIWLFSFSAKLILLTDFSEFYDRNISKETDDYLKELEDQPWTGQRK